AVGQSIGLFVRKAGMKLFANQGPVIIQAQNDKLELLARQGLDIVSTEDEIHITARRKITFNAGGTYITLDPHRIELGTKGDCNIKAAHFAFLGPARLAPDLPVLPAKEAEPSLPVFVSPPLGGPACGKQIDGPCTREDCPCIRG
ncbi:hypothetical protein BWR15_30575, partial [Pseudomonas sp. T]